MTDGEIIVPVVLFISLAAVITYSMKRWFDLKRESMLAEAALRRLEMEKGFPPGTYSRRPKGGRMSAKAWQKAQDATNAKNEKDERRDLEKGIEDLKARMADIDTIVSDRKEKGRR